MKTIESKINDTVINSEMNTIYEKELAEYINELTKIERYEDKLLNKTLINKCFSVPRIDGYEYIKDSTKFAEMGIIKDINRCERTITVNIFYYDITDEKNLQFNADVMKMSVEKFFLHYYGNLITFEQFKTFKESFCKLLIKHIHELKDTFVNTLL